VELVTMTMTMLILAAVIILAWIFWPRREPPQPPERTP
jgi:hypothetical protein